MRFFFFALTLIALNGQAQPQATLNQPIFKITKDVEKDSKASFTVIAQDVASIDKITLNDESIVLVDGKAVIQKILKNGLNEFLFVATNKSGASSWLKDSYYKVSPEERKAEALKMQIKEQEEKKWLLQKKQDEDRIAREGDGSEDDKKCQRYGSKPSTPTYIECRVKLEIEQRQAEDRQKDYELRQRELAQRQLEQLRLEAGNAQAQAALLNELRRQQGADQLNSLTRSLLEMGRPQMLAPSIIQVPQTTNCTSRYNRIANTVQTTCD